MNTSGEIADLLVKEGIQVTEAAAKLAGLGAKNLAAIIVALLNEDTKLQGMTNLKQLLKSGKPLCILTIKESDLAKFNKEAKNYGVLFAPVKDKTGNNGLCDIIAKQDDVATLNYIMERLGYAAVEKEPEPEQEKSDNDNPQKNMEDNEKNAPTRASEHRQEKKSPMHGSMEHSDRGTKHSVKKKVEEIKEQQAEAKTRKEPEKEKAPQYREQQKKSKKKNKGKKKGRSR